MAEVPSVTVEADVSSPRPPWYGQIVGSVPHLDQYFGLWCIHEQTFRAAVGQFQGFNLSAHVEAQGAAPSARVAYRGDGYQIEPGGIAVIEISGPMMKYASSLSGGTSTVRVRRELSHAATNDDVKQIVLRVDSPGGTVAGTEDLAAAVRNAAAIKPVIAFIEDLGASAAYWAASQATKIYAANQTTLVGSIGTYGVIYDYSAQAAMIGVKVHVVHAGEFKGAGAEGTEITQKQLDEWQRVIDQLNAQFLAGVAAGRKLSPATVAGLADGRVHVAEDALGLRLIDGVQSFETTLSQLRATGPRSNKAMSETTTPAPAAKQPATYDDLKACLPGVDAEFICGQLERKATLDQAQSAWMEEQNRRVTAEREKNEQLAASQQRKPGVPPLQENVTGSAAGGEWDDPVSAWNEKVDAEVTKGRTPAQACRIVNKANPGLREAMVEAANAGRTPRRNA